MMSNEGKDLGLLSWLRVLELPSPEAMPVSYPFRLVYKTNNEPPFVSNGTTLLRPVGSDLDKFRLGLPLYSLTLERALPSAKENSQIVLVPLSEATGFLWRKYGVNLVALSSLQDACENGLPTLPILLTDVAKAFEYFRMKEHEDRFFNDVRVIMRLQEIPLPAGIPCECYMIYEDVTIIVGMLERQLGIGLEGFNAGGHGPGRPFLDVAVIYPDVATDSDRAEVLFFDGPDLEPVARAPLPGGLANKPLQDYRRVCAARARQLRQWRERLASHDMNSRGARPSVPIMEWSRFEKKQHECVREGRRAHLDLVEALRKSRPTIIGRQATLTRVREQQKARQLLLADKREVYTPLMAQILDVLPHMSVLPTGVDVQITPFHDSVLGQAALRVQRPASRPGGEAKQIEFRDTLLRKPSFPTLQDAANGVFGGPNSGRNWIFPVGYVGLAKLAQGASAHNRAVDLETLATDFWCLVRPQAVERIRKNGLQDWWYRNGHEGRATDTFFGLMTFLASVCIPRGEKAEDFIHGIIQISAAGKIARSGTSADRVVWRFNPEVARLITGAGSERSHFMVVNSQAMFGYEKKELLLAPALQLYLEYRTRAAYFKGNLLGTEGELVTPNGDGVTFAKLAERLGLPAGRRPSETVTRLKAALDTVAKRGVVAGLRRTGATRRNPLEEQVAIRMSPDYLALYDHARLRREEQECRRRLETPFAPERKRTARRAAEGLVSKRHMPEKRS